MKIPSFPSAITTPTTKCDRCPCNKRLHFHVPTTGGLTPLLILQGTPTTNDVSRKQYLSGASGEFYTNRLFSKAGITKYKMTALIKCQPKVIKGTNLEEAFKCCSELFLEDLKGVRAVLLLGEIPLNLLLGLEKINSKRGSIYTYNDIKIIPTIAPGELVRATHANKEERKKSKIPPPAVVIDDMKKIQAIVDETIIYDKEPYYDIDPSYETLVNFLHELQDADTLVAIDIETTYAPPDKAVPEIVAFATEKETICVNFDDHLEFIGDALASPSGKIFQNGLFDVRVLEGVGFRVNNWTFDTMYAHHLLVSELPHSLGFIQSMYTTIPYHKDMVRLKDKDE